MIIEHLTRKDGLILVDFSSDEDETFLFSIITREPEWQKNKSLIYEKAEQALKRQLSAN